MISVVSLFSTRFCKFRALVRRLCCFHICFSIYLHPKFLNPDFALIEPHTNFLVACALSLRTTRRASLDRRASTGTIPQPVRSHRSVMKPANNHLRLVRQTIYEDPGNPFADEDELSGSAETGWKDFDWSRDSATDIQNGAPTPRTAAPKALEGMEKTERPRLRRSQSVFDNAEQDSSGDEYVPIRAQWRKESIAEMQEEDTKRRQSETRDTKFYGFYNDIFEDEVWRRKV